MDNQTELQKAQMQTQAKVYETDLNAHKDLTLAQHQAEVSAVMQDSQHAQALRLEDGKMQSQFRLKQMEGAKTPEQQQAESDAVTEQVRGIQEGLGQLAQMIGQLGKLVTAPRELIRDKSGRPVGSRVSLES
jgi:hypothetical protein